MVAQLESASLLTLMSELCVKLGNMLTSFAASDSMLTHSFDVDAVVVIVLLGNMTSIPEGLSMGMKLALFCLKYKVADQ